MSKISRSIYIIYALLMALFLLWPGVAEGVFDIHAPISHTNLAAHEPVVQQLVDIVAANPAFQADMEAALLEQGASSYWHGKTLDDMYQFFDEWVIFLPHIDDARQYMDRFYEFADGGRGQKLAASEPLRSWLYQFMLAVGEFNDSPASAAAVHWWTWDPRINMADYIVPSGGYSSFNEFFTRRIKAGVRPIDSPLNPGVIVSPADSSLMKIADKLTSSATISVKGENLNIYEMLGKDQLAKDFINGKAVLCMLNTTDYHRYHAPVSGRIVSQKQMAGLYYGMDGGWVEYFFQHRRGYFIFDTQQYGHVAMVCVGMFTISSVNFITYQGDFVNKGDELGNFAYGGSAVILLFEQGRASFTVPLEGRPVHVNMGQRNALGVQDKPVTHDFSMQRPSGSGITASPPIQTPVLLPNIFVKSATISTSRAAPGERVIISADVVNNSTVNGTSSIKVYVNGELENSQGITVNSGSSTPVTFTVSRNEPGTYSVYVGGTQAGSFTVDQFAPETILYLSGALVFFAFILGVIYITTRRQPRY
ncbi:MAG: phosphatidylserine decarboxylase [Chloroflexi bacterium]|nr:phosphatidylserine decarboxylase [Chloroflexota bacterium]